MTNPDQLIQQLQQVARQYGRATSNFYSDPEGTAQLAGQYPAVMEWFKATVQEHKAEMEAKSVSGRAIETALRNLKNELNRFMESGRNFGQTFWDKFNEHTAKARKNVDMAFKVKGVGMFQAAQLEINKAKGLITILSSFNSPQDESVQKAQAQYESLIADVGSKQAEFRLLTVKQVKMPTEGYRAADKEAIRQTIQQAWQTTYPEDTILRIVLHSNQWEVTSRAKWDQGRKDWQFSETATLPAKVIVQKDEQTATIYMAYINRDTLGGGQNCGVRTKNSEYLIEDIPLANVT